MIYMVQESSDSDSYGSRPSLNSVPISYLLFAHRKKFEQFLSNVDFYDNFSHGNKLQYRYGFVRSATLVVVKMPQKGPDLETGGKVGKEDAACSGSSCLAAPFPFPFPPARLARPTRLAELGGSSKSFSVAL